MTIELVIQTPSGRVPVQASPQTTLDNVVASISDSSNATSLRYLQTSVHRSQWETMTLFNLGLKDGARAKLILETTSTAAASAGDTDVVMEDTTTTTTAPNNTESQLKAALSTILKQNFDVESQTCLVTLMKVLDNVIQKPNNVKVRSIRLANPAVHDKIVLKGGVDYLLVCGFVRQTAAPQLLSTTNDGDECLVLLEANESTPRLVQARRLLMQTAIQELGMTADDLPKYKPPPAAVSVSTNSSTNSSSNTFNPYQRHRYNATGQPQQPDSYESTTETKLRQLQSKQAKMEAKFAGKFENRELVAFYPPTSTTTVDTTTTSSATNGPSDGTLLAQRMQRLQKEEQERQQGGFTTKAMRDLKRAQNQKVYSHVSLRIQFPDGSSIEAKFLPRETVAQVKQVLVEECFSIEGLQFDLYVAPPRRKLDPSQTLQQEGLVPAAKCFCSWTGSNTPSNGTAFLKPQLFQSQAAAPAFPTAKPVVAESAKPQADTFDDKSNVASSGAAKKPSREEDLLRRMMGGGSSKGASGSAKRSGDKKSGSKPKWFKG